MAGSGFEALVAQRLLCLADVGACELSPHEAAEVVRLDMLQPRRAGILAHNLPDGGRGERAPGWVVAAPVEGGEDMFARDAFVGAYVQPLTNFGDGLAAQGRFALHNVILAQHHDHVAVAFAPNVLCLHPHKFTHAQRAAGQRSQQGGVAHADIVFAVGKFAHGAHLIGLNAHSRVGLDAVLERGLLDPGDESERRSDLRAHIALGSSLGHDALDGAEHTVNRVGAEHSLLCAVRAKAGQCLGLERCLIAAGEGEVGAHVTLIHTYAGRRELTREHIDTEGQGRGVGLGGLDGIDGGPRLRIYLSYLPR